MEGVLHALNYLNNLILILLNSHIHLHMVREYNASIPIWRALKPILSDGNNYDKSKASAKLTFGTLGDTRSH